MSSFIGTIDWYSRKAYLFLRFLTVVCEMYSEGQIVGCFSNGTRNNPYCV
jgi:hypothetical protein